MGDKGTLALYFSGHGTPDGRFVTTQGYLGFDEITGAIESSRSTPLKRVIIFNDSCFSGNWVEGSETMESSSLLGSMRANLLSDDQSAATAANGRGSVEMDAKSGDKFADTATQAISRVMRDRNGDNRVFEQLLVMSASRDNETSLDLGSANGGAFTYSLRKVLTNLKATNSNAKMRDLIDQTISLTESRYNHKPMFNVFPENIMEGALFGRSSPVGGSNGSAGTATLQRESEKAHLAGILTQVNDKLESCSIKIDEIAIGANAQGWYRTLIYADYVGGESSLHFYGWFNLHSTVEEEAKRLLKVVPGSYFPGCKRKLPTSGNSPFAKERSHMAKTLSALNAKLKDCSISLDKVTSGKDDRGVYRFLFKATYADGSTSEQRASWGQINDSAEKETGAFLEAIPSRYFDRCKHL